MTKLQMLYKLGFVLFIIKECLSLHTCTDDQYTKRSLNGSITCVDCFECPKGLGPSVECASLIQPDTNLECRGCKYGVSFSPSNDYEQCQPCSICSDDQVSKPCTSGRDTVCKKQCISKENYYEKSSYDCQACSYCCGDGNDIVIDECKKKGMPAHKSCTVHRKKECSPPATTSQPTTVRQTTPSTPLPSKAIAFRKPTKNNNVLIREVTRRKTTTNSTSISSEYNNTVTNTRWQVFIGVSCGIGFLVLACLIYLLITQRTRCLKTFLRRSEESPAFTYYYDLAKSKEDRNLVAKESSYKLFELLEKDYKLKEKISNKLDTQKSFAKLARHFKMDEDKLKKLEERCDGDAPSEKVFHFLESNDPNLLVSDFARCLEEIDRKDILDIISSKLSNSSTNQISVTLT